MKTFKIRIQRLFRLIGIIFGFGNYPDFFILGAQKSGTTSLFNYMEEYSNNFKPPLLKEIRYFTERYHLGMIWYKTWFPLFLNRKLTGEATPTYMFYPNAIKRIESKQFNSKYIVILRNPVDRAYSHYQHYINRDNKNPVWQTFEEAIKDELNDIDIYKNDEFTYKYKYHSFISRGIYYRQLENIFKLVPKERVLIINSDDFYLSPEKTVPEIFGFLGLNFKSNVLADYKVYNKNEYNQMSPETREKLKGFFEPYNEKLFELIGERYNW